MEGIQKSGIINRAMQTQIYIELMVEEEEVIEVSELVVCANQSARAKDTVE